MSTATRLLTAEDLLQLDADDARHELIEGVLVTMPPTGDEHGGIVAAVTEPLRRHVRTNRLGIVRAGETGFLLSTDPDTVRAPDVAFISQERVAANGPVRGYRRGAPDLAVEVVSPSDRYTDVEEKVALWFRHGARMVVVINPRRTVAAYRSPTQVRLLTTGDLLDGEDVIPGWLLPIADIFEELPSIEDIRP